MGPDGPYTGNEITCSHTALHAGSLELKIFDTEGHCVCDCFLYLICYCEVNVIQLCPEASERSIQTVSLSSLLILCFTLNLLFPWSFLVKILHAFLLSLCACWTAHLAFHDFFLLAAFPIYTGRWVKVSKCLPQLFLFDFLLALPLSLTSFSTWQNKFVPCHTIGLFHLNFNSDSLLGALILLLLFAWLNNDDFPSNSINKFWVAPSSLKGSLLNLLLLASPHYLM